MSFRTLLVANRGEIARRVIRSARAMGIRCAAVYVDADADAPFVADADLALRLPDSYLDGKALLRGARTWGAGALHRGYGFLSENAGFAADVIAAGLAWVGPSPDAIARMGDKLAAKALAREVGGRSTTHPRRLSGCGFSRVEVPASWESSLGYLDRYGTSPKNRPSTNGIWKPGKLR